jgi:hypothetical protein
VKLGCDAALARRVASEAARDGLPAELWTRIVVEAARVRDDVATISGVRSKTVARQLDRAAGRPQPDVVGVGELAIYARVLRNRAPRKLPRSDTGNTLVVMVSDTIRCAWLAEAADSHLTLAAWVAARLRDAPAGAIAWEASAAATGRELGEWGYSSWLARRANSAAAQMPG